MYIVYAEGNKNLSHKLYSLVLNLRRNKIDVYLVIYT